MPGGSIAEWTSEQGEPRIRVGIALPTDDMTRVRMDIPTGGYEITSNNRDLGTAPVGHAEVVVDGTSVRFTSSVTPRSWSVDVLRLEAMDPEAPHQGAGIRLHDLLTGRGFHWQKRVSFSMLGTLEFRVVDGRLLIVNELSLEDYLQGVITAEMSGECPLEFLKSQCIVARSWVLAHTEPKHTEWPIDRCNDDCCQRYHGTSYWTPRAADAVTGTCGQVVTDGAGHIIDANYSKSCGGIIEAPENVWFVKKTCQRAAVDAPVGSPVRRFMPVSDGNLDEFLVGEWLAGADVFCSPNVVPDRDLPKYLGSVDEGGGHFRWVVEYPRKQLEELISRKLPGVFVEPARAASGGGVLVADIPPRTVAARMPVLAALRELRLTKRGPSGRASELEIDYADAAGNLHCAVVRSEYRIREVLHEKFLYSSAFKIDMEREGDGVLTVIRLRGAGWGHGAGLCQIGALGMALKGYSCRDILQHYFEDVQIRAFY
jgi:peptidoglycan hydrolase-like amidase